MVYYCLMSEPIRDPKWGEEAGAAESSAAIIELVSTALENPQLFLALVQPLAPGHPRPKSPLERSVVLGMATIGLAENNSGNDSGEVRQYLEAGGYSTEEIAAAAAFSFERVPIAALLHPEKLDLLAEGIDLAASRARMAASDVDPDLFLPPEKYPAIVEAAQSFQDFCTPMGRVKAIVEPAAEIIRHRRNLLPEMIGAIAAGSGGWGKPTPSLYSGAVALGLRKLLKVGV